MRKFWWAIPALFLMVLSGPRSLRADTITQNLSSVSVVGSTPAWGISLFPSTSGTLTSVNIDISGTIKWTATTSSDKLQIVLIPPPGVSLQASQSFSATNPGTYSESVDFSLTTTSLTGWTGTGSQVLGLDLFSAIGDTYSGNLSGTLTYNYTPVPTPEPSAALLLLIGLAAVVLARKRFAGGADATT